ncbi:MAG: tetratricopeptide repeat protein [Bacteroidota bacterium]
MKKHFLLSCFLCFALVLPGQEASFDSPGRQHSDSLFFSLKSNLETAKKGFSPLHKIKAHLALGEFYRKTGVYSEAMEQFKTALELLGSMPKDSLYLYLNNSIGKVHLSLNRFELAEQYFLESVNLSKVLGNTKGLAVSKGLLGVSYEKEGKYLEALAHQKESLSLFQILKHNDGIATTNENIGSIYEDLEQYDLAHDYFLKSYGYLKGKGIWQEANVLNNLGDVYRKSGDYGNAMVYTKKAMDVASKIEDNHQLESAHKDLSKTYALSEDFRQAHYHLLEAEKFHQAWLEDQDTNQLNVLHTIYDTNKKESQIELLKEQNRTNRAYQNLLWVALFPVLAIFTVTYIYLIRKRKAKLKIQAYEQRVLKAELEKREMEEKNLHEQVRLKTAALSRYSLHLSQKNKILLDLSKTLKNIVARRNTDFSFKLRQLVREIDFNLQQEDEWDEFMNFFKEIHPEFIKKLSSLSHNSLSPSELRLGMLLRLNLSSKEIASILRVTPDSVRVARYRLRKKLPIDQKKELVHFMVEL